MSKVIAYENTERVCFCQIRFDSREKVLVSVAAVPVPSIKVIRLLFGIVPYQTIWEFGVPAPEGIENSFNKLVGVLNDQKDPRVKHPLDAVIRKLLPCRSCAEAVQTLRQTAASAPDRSEASGTL